MGPVAAARKRSYQWCPTLSSNNTETIERMTCYCFLRPIRRDLTSSSYKTNLKNDRVFLQGSAHGKDILRLVEKTSTTYGRKNDGKNGTNSNFFICSCVIYLMLFYCLNFAPIRRFVCVLDYEKGKPGLGGLPQLKCKDARLLDLVRQTGANFGLTEGLRDGNPNIFTHTDIAQGCS